jgi:hypothetical protein
VRSDVVRILTVKMEAVLFSETSINLRQPMRRKIPEDTLGQRNSPISEANSLRSRGALVSVRNDLRHVPDTNKLETRRLSGQQSVAVSRQMNKRRKYNLYSPTAQIFTARALGLTTNVVQMIVLGVKRCKYKRYTT